MWVSEVRPELAVQIHYEQAAGITGHFMLFVLLIMQVMPSVALPEA